MTNTEQRHQHAVLTKVRKEALDYYDEARGYCESDERKEDDRREYYIEILNIIYNPDNLFLLDYDTINRMVDHVGFLDYVYEYLLQSEYAEECLKGNTSLLKDKKANIYQIIDAMDTYKRTKEGEHNGKHDEIW
jgi:hypothetical protein